jgi:hypothetical protein
LNSNFLSVFDRYEFNSDVVAKCGFQTFSIRQTVLCDVDISCANGKHDAQEKVNDVDVTDCGGTCQPCPSPATGFVGAIINGCLKETNNTTATFDTAAKTFSFRGNFDDGTYFLLGIDNVNPFTVTINQEIKVPAEYQGSSEFSLSTRAADIHTQTIFNINTSSSVKFTKLDITNRLMSGTFTIVAADERQGIRYLSSGKFEDILFTIP